VISPSSKGFASNLLGGKSELYPGLADLAHLDENVKLECRFDIGKEKGKQVQPHFSMLGMNMELTKEDVPVGHPGLPGINGPRPKTSSGAFAVKVSEEPYFVNMNGMQRVQFEKGCWEIIWRKDVPCGALICGFQLPNSNSHNGAVLPSGRFYMTLPVWTHEGLAAMQAKKHKVRERVIEFEEKKRAAFEKLDQEKNLLMKAFAYREAAAAFEKIEMSGFHNYKRVPGSDGIIPFTKGLLLQTTGKVFTKEDGWFGEARHDIVGSVHISTPVVDQELLAP